MQKVIETLDGIITNLGDMPIEDYVKRRAESQDILNKTEWHARQSEYVKNRCQEIEEFIEKNDRAFLEGIVFEFNEAHRKFEDEYSSCDSVLIKKRREELDALARNYCLIGLDAEIERCELRKKAKDDAGIRDYVFKFKKRAEVTEDFKNIKEIFRRFGAGNSDREKLRNLAKGRVIGGSRLNLTSVVKAYKKVGYYEGVVEAEKLQRDIFDCLRGYVRPHSRAGQEESGIKENPEAEKGYFCLYSYLFSIGYPKNESYFGIYDRLLGRREKSMMERLGAAREHAASLSPSNEEEDIRYMGSIIYGLRESTIRGEIGEKARYDSKIRSTAKGALEQLGDYVEACKKSRNDFLSGQIIMSERALAA